MAGRVILSPKEIKEMRVACQLAAETLVLVGDMIRPGVTTEEINTFVHEHTLKQGGIPAPLNYRGFPKSVCTSINEVVCHGIHYLMKRKPYTEKVSFSFRRIREKKSNIHLI